MVRALNDENDKYYTLYTFALRCCRWIPGILTNEAVIGLAGSPHIMMVA